MSTKATSTLVAAHRSCEEITRRRARNFYYGLRLAPEPQRAALFTLYAWMRRADDIVDDGAIEPDARRVRLEAFRASTDGAMRGDIPDNEPLWLAFADSFHRFDLAAAAFHEMLDGQIEDLSAQRYATFDDLRRYCYRVASSVGVLCIQIWGYDDPRATDLAVDRGIAFQLTNILRDFRQDYDVGRVYLPADEFSLSDLTPEELRHWARPGDCARFIQAQALRAREYYERSADLDSMISESCRPVLWAMSAIYRGILEKIHQSPMRVVDDRRVRLGALRKCAIGVRAKWFVHRNGHAVR